MFWYLAGWLMVALVVFMVRVSAVVLSGVGVVGVVVFC